MMESRAPIDTGAARARLDPGARVSTFGLSKAEFNDHRGTVLGKLKNGRYIVLLDEASASLSPIKVRIENLQVLEHVSPNFERLAEYALTSDAIRKEADIDALTDHIATGNFSEAQVAEVLVDALVLHVLPTDDLIASNQEYHCRWTSPVATGEYVICNVNTRPELNGQVCSVSGGMYGRAEFATNNVQVHTTGELILLHNNKLVPLEEAPAILLYDEADLALDEHPLHSASNLVQFLSLPNPKPFAVRVHALPAPLARRSTAKSARPFGITRTAALPCASPAHRSAASRGRCGSTTLAFRASMSAYQQVRRRASCRRIMLRAAPQAAITPPTRLSPASLCIHHLLGAALRSNGMAQAGPASTRIGGSPVLRQLRRSM